MRATILFLGLVAMCQGLYPEDDRVAELMDLLHRASKLKMEDARAYPRLSRGMFAGESMPPQDPSVYDLDRLFEFPGSNDLVRMITRNFSDPSPLRSDLMRDFPEGFPPCMDTYIKNLEPRWQASLFLFCGDFAGLPEMYTRRFTEMVANLRFACPSTYFDKIFARWTYKHLTDAFSAQDDSMYNFIYDKVVELFPLYDVTKVKAISEEAVFKTHWWIFEEMMQHIFGYGFHDVAVFSHTLYQTLTNYFKTMDMCSVNPDMTSRGSIGEMVKSALYKSQVGCQTGMAIIDRYGDVIKMFKTRYEELTTERIATNVVSILLGNVHEVAGVKISIDNTVVKAISMRIRKYVDTILADLEKVETSLLSPVPDITSLQQFMESMLGPGETNLIPEMFERLGFRKTDEYGSSMDVNM